MMFKGTDTIGTRDPEKDARYRTEQKALRDEINRLVWTRQYDRYFKGEIDDPWNPTNDTQELRVLRARLDALPENAAPLTELTALMALIRRACGIDGKLTPFSETVRRNFQTWIMRRHAGVGTADLKAEQFEVDILRRQEPEGALKQLLLRR